MTSSPSDTEERARGDRAEAVASWYLRVNGFMAIPGFIVHLDHRTSLRRDQEGKPITARTEADFVAVRFPYSKEIVNKNTLIDDPKVVHNLLGSRKLLPLFVLAEVKASRCRMNGPWTNYGEKNMQRVLRRMGFTNSEDTIEAAAEALYGPARWEGDDAIVQYICFGSEASHVLCEKHANLVQITWNQIGAFLFKRHKNHPEKTPSGFVHSQWPEFGKTFGEWFVHRNRVRDSELAAGQFVENYVRAPRTQ